MNGMNGIKKIVIGLSLSAAFLVSTGAAISVSAQDWRYGDRRYPGYDYREEEKGYRDGLRRGREDAETRRVPDPANSSHYRKGTNAYREGFRRGCPW